MRIAMNHFKLVWSDADASFESRNLNAGRRKKYALTLLAVLALAGLPMRTAQAATYTWTNANVTGAATLDWFSGGPDTQAAWSLSAPTGAGLTNADTIQFFADTATAFTNTTAVTQTSNINNGGTAVQLQTLTLNGKGSGTSGANYTLTLSGDPLNFSASTGTINLNGVTNSRTVTYNLNSNIQLGTASSADALTITGAGSDTFNIGGNISELQAGGGSVIKNGTSSANLSGILSQSGGVAVSGGALSLSNAGNTYAGGTTISGGAEVNYASDASLGNTSGGINFNGTGGYLFLSSGASVTLGANRTITVGNGATAFLGDSDINNNPETITINGQITGAGGIDVGHYQLGTGVMNLNSTGNNFQGSVIIGTQAGLYQFQYSQETLNVASLADGVGDGNIVFAQGNNSSGNTAIFAWSANAIAPLVLNNRHIQIDRLQPLDRVRLHSLG